MDDRPDAGPQAAVDFTVYFEAVTAEVDPSLWFVSEYGNVIDPSAFDYGTTGEPIEFEAKMEDGFTKIELDDWASPRSVLRVDDKTLHDEGNARWRAPLVGFPSGGEHLAAWPTDHTAAQKADATPGPSYRAQVKPPGETRGREHDGEPVREGC